MKKRILSLILVMSILSSFVVALEITAFAATSGTCGTNLNWKLDSSGTLTISGKGKMNDYFLDSPPWYEHTTENNNNVPIKRVEIKSGVTSIGDNAFLHCENILSVTIPDTVTHIGKMAFCCCRNLKSVSIPDTVTYIDEAAFVNCDSLTNITIPESVTFIGEDIVLYDENIISIDVDVNNTKYCSEEGILFDKEKTKLMAYPAKKSGEYVVPDTVTVISENAFSECRYINKITIPKGISSMDETVFADCRALRSIDVDLQNSNYSSYDGVLFDKNKTRLICFPKAKSGSYKIPNSVTSLAYLAFRGCYSLSSVTFSEQLVEIGELQFKECSNLQYLNIPDNITKIGSSAFADCIGLQTVNIGSGLNSIKESAFYGCSNLTTISVDEYNKNYCSEDGVILNRDKTEIVIVPCGKSGVYYVPETINTIKTNAFYKCNKLNEIVLHNNVTTVKNSAFAECGGVKRIIIPDSVTFLGSYAFADCINLSNVIIGSGITAIEDEMFYNCTSLNTINIPDNIQSIGVGAFERCKNLKTLNIGASLKKIDFGAFFALDNLTTVYYRGTTEEWKKIKIDMYNDSLINANVVCLKDNDIDFDTFDSYLTKKAAALLDNSNYNFCKNSPFPHTLFADELGKAVLMESYYRATEDFVNFKSTNFYEVILYEALFKNNNTDHIVVDIDNFINENAPVKFAELCNSAFSDAFGDKHYYTTSEFLDKKIGVSEEALIKSGMAEDYTSSIGDAFEIISFAGKTYREIYESYQKAYALSMASSSYNEVLSAIKNETDDKDLKEAIEKLIADLNSSFSSMVTESMIDYSNNTILNSVVEFVFDNISDRIPELLLYKYAFKTGKFVADEIYNAKELSYDALCIIAINNTDIALRKALDKQEFSFILDPTDKNASILISMADSFKSLLLYGCDISNRFVENCADGNVKSIIFKGVTGIPGAIINSVKCKQVSEDILSIKNCLHNYDFYAGLENEDGNETTLVTEVTDFVTDDENRFAIETPDSLYNEINDYMNEYTYVSGISLNKHEKTIVIGEDVSLIASITPNNATNKNITWSSSNDKIAHVKNGKVIGISTGTVTITATSNCGNFVDSCIIVVEPNAIYTEHNVIQTETGLTQIILTTTNVPNNSILVVAGYDDKNQLVNTVFPSINSTNTINITNKDIKIVKYFIWNGLKYIMPLCDAKKIEL